MSLESFIALLNVSLKGKKKGPFLEDCLLILDVKLPFMRLDSAKFSCEPILYWFQMRCVYWVVLLVLVKMVGHQLHGGGWLQNFEVVGSQSRVVPPGLKYMI